MDRSQLWYVYFKFYIDQADIDEGLKKYTINIENMAPVGYNYKEYKVYTDNIGGLEHWVGDLGGYVSRTRDVGFTDAAPSEAIYDATLLMSKSRYVLTDITFLNLFKPPYTIYIRKITASAVGSVKVEFVLSAYDKYEKRFYETFNETRTEIYNITQDIVDNSTATYSITVELGAGFDLIEKEILSSEDFTNPERSNDTLLESYATFSTSDDDGATIVYDLGAPKSVSKIYNKYDAASSGTTRMYLYHSLNNADWTTIRYRAENGSFEDTEAMGDIDMRYIKIFFKRLDAGSCSGKVYDVIVIPS